MLENGEQAAPETDADSQSIEDKLASQFFPDQSDEPSEATTKPEADAQNDEQETEDKTAEQLEEVEYDGERYQVPPKLKEAIIRQSDYTKKTQEIAEQRRNLELQAEQLRLASLERSFTDSIQQEMRQLAAFQTQQEYILQNWNQLSAEDRANLQYVTAQIEKLNAELNGKRQKFRQDFEQHMGQLRANALETLQKSIPGWSEQLAKEIAEHARADGYTDQELQSIIDPRHAKTLWKAMQYDKLQAKAKDVTNKVTKAPPPVKTGVANTMPQKVREDLNLRKAQKAAKTESEKARIIEQRLMNQFR